MRLLSGRVPGKKFVIVDSLVTMLLHNEVDAVERFARSIANKANENDAELAVMFTKDEEKDLLKKIIPFFDKVIEVD